MSYFQDATLLPSTLHHGKSLGEKKPVPYDQLLGQQLRSKGSIASLVSIVRNPVAAVGDVVDGLRDGLTKEERADKRRADDQKQILYLRLRNVSVKVVMVDAPDPRELTFPCQRPHRTTNGRRLLKPLINSRVTTPGSSLRTLRITMLALSPPD